MYEEPEKLSDNEALNELVESVKNLNKKVSLFYWLAILGIVLLIIDFILPFVSYA